MRSILVLVGISAALIFSMASTVNSEAIDGSLARADAAGGGTDLGLGGNDAGGGYDAYTPGYDAYTPGYDAYTPGYDAYTPGYDAAGAGTCTVNDVFYDSTNVCQSGNFCGLLDNNPTCLPDAAAAGGTFYGACGGNGECPVGSMCAGATTADATCMPLCSDTHTTCPENGACVYGLTGQPALKLCAPTDDCDPVANSGCASGNCYIIDQVGTTMCVSAAGTATEGQPCQYIDDCAPTLLCMQTGCMPMCNIGSTTECTSGQTCQNVGLPSWGVCG